MVIAVGGGITGDVVSFISSIFKRGINFINIPTTLLAQVDSAVGGKTGVNSKPSMPTPKIRQAVRQVAGSTALHN